MQHRANKDLSMWMIPVIYASISSHLHLRISKNCWHRKAFKHIKIPCLPRDSSLNRFGTFMNIYASTGNKRNLENKKRSWKPSAITKNLGLVHHLLALYKFTRRDFPCTRLQNSPYFCVFKYARAVKQKVWDEAENRERDWGQTLKIRTVRFAYVIYVQITRFSQPWAIPSG